MAELTRPTAFSSKPLATIGQITADLTEYRIQSAPPMTAVSATTFALTDMAITFSAPHNVPLSASADIFNWGTVGILIEVGIVEGHGTRALSDRILKHNYTGTTTPASTSTETIVSGDMDGGTF